MGELRGGKGLWLCNFYLCFPLFSPYLNKQKKYLKSRVPSDGGILTEVFVWLCEWEACLSLSLSVVRLTSYVYFKGFNEKHQESGKSSVEQIIFSVTPMLHLFAILCRNVSLIFIFVFCWLEHKTHKRTRFGGYPRYSPAWEPWSASLNKMPVSIVEGGSRLWMCDWFMSFKILLWNDFIFLNIK